MVFSRFSRLLALLQVQLDFLSSRYLSRAISKKPSRANARSEELRYHIYKYIYKSFYYIGTLVLHIYIYIFTFKPLYFYNEKLQVQSACVKNVHVRCETSKIHVISTIFLGGNKHQPQILINFFTSLFPAWQKCLEFLKANAVALFALQWHGA